MTSMIIKRSIKSQVVEALGQKKVIIIYGARQVGKTTLVKEIIAEIPNSAYFSCDEPDVREALTNKTSTEMRAFIGGASTIVFDEAQRVTNIGLSLKLLHDSFPDLTIVATGSSSFELANKIVEPLTGRNISFTLYPISFNEYATTIGENEARRLLNHRMIYGMYPAVINSQNPEQEIKLLTQDYLFKDLLAVETVRKPMLIEKLAKLLALQMGQEVSYRELAQKLEVSSQTITSYIKLLEQAFIVFRVSPLGKNPRNEITRFEKIYFFDQGIRNALIDNFGEIETRVDKGQIFEGFFITERLKDYQITDRFTKQYFWRTKDGSEVDLIEEAKQKLTAYECKFGQDKISTRAWQNSFPDVPVNLVNRTNITDYLKTKVNIRFG